jgi:hypothetical protein
MALHLIERVHSAIVMLSAYGLRQEFDARNKTAWSNA